MCDSGDLIVGIKRSSESRKKDVMRKKAMLGEEKKEKEE